MPISTNERTVLREELVSQGYHWEYIDEWQPKVALYRHLAILSQSGEVVSDVGSKLVNLPGNPDYVAKKARIGLFPWPPSEACNCRWCLGRRGPDEVVTRQMETTVEATEGMQPPSVPPTASEGRGSKKFGPHLQQS